jgi:hypothetical protein
MMIHFSKQSTCPLSFPLMSIWGGGGAAGKKNNKLTERLARNLEAAKKNPTQVQAGIDNRSDILHPARFMPGPTCKNTEVWLAARKEIGLSGHEPVSKYDFDGIGINDRLKSFLITNIHQLGSKEFSLKMLNKKALDAARAGTSKDSSHPVRDFENIQEIRMALATL